MRRQIPVGSGKYVVPADVQKHAVNLAVKAAEKTVQGVSPLPISTAPELPPVFAMGDDDPDNVSALPTSAGVFIASVVAGRTKGPAPPYHATGFASAASLEAHFVKHAKEWGAGNITRIDASPRAASDELELHAP